MKHYKSIKEKFVNFNYEFFQKQPSALYNPISYAMESGGKYIRPQLMLYASELFNADIEDVYLNAYGIELFHNFTLLHDDIMDNSDIRRGKPAVFKKYGLNSGILSGDLMLIKSLQIASSLKGKTNPELFDLVSHTAIQIHEGQQMDVDFESLPLVSEEDYIKMIEYKTAVLLACSLQMGAIIANASIKNQEKIYEFGRLIGIAFQIQDDYLDAFGDEKVGKKIGGDILNNKKTLLFIASMHLGNDMQKSSLLEYFKTKDLNDDAKIDAVKNIFIESGGQKYCANKMRDLQLEAIKILNSLENINETAKNNLLEITEMIIVRNS